MMDIVYLNGTFLEQDEAKISVRDRGFTFSDSVYEIIPVFGKNVLSLSEHLSRLNDSLSYIDIPSPHTEKEWEDIIYELLNKNPESKLRSVYIQVTRGEDEREFTYSDGLKPSVYAMCKPVPDRDLSSGVKAVTHEDIRWQYCHIKATALLAGVLLKKHASSENALETILIRQGKLTEGAASNVFIVKNNIIKTPQKDGYILPGITRDLIIGLSQNSGLMCQEVLITESELRNADEIWITSSTMGVVPVIFLDENTVGDGKPGVIWKQVNTAYQALIWNGTDVQ